MRPSGNVYNMLSACARRLGALAWCAALSFLPTGCAIHYFDDKTGTEHLIGFGHMRMKVAPPQEGVQAIVTAVDTLGVSVDGGSRNYGFAIGFSRSERVEVVDANASVALVWPDASLFNLRAGTVPPFLPKNDLEDGLPPSR